MWLIDWDIHKICLNHFDLKEENYTVILSLMLFVFPVSDIYPSARGKNKMETFQALARTSTRSQSWLGIKWLGRTHWWIWHGGTCAYFLLCVTVIFIVNSVIIIIIVIIVVIVLVIIKLYNMSFWIMCIKGICSWFLIDTLDQHLSHHSILLTSRLILCRHLRSALCPHHHHHHHQTLLACHFGSCVLKVFAVNWLSIDTHDQHLNPHSILLASRLILGRH